MSSPQQAVQRFEEIALSGIKALIAQHQADDLDAISQVLGIAAQRLRPEFGDAAANVAWQAVIEWREQADEVRDAKEN